MNKPKRQLRMPLEVAVLMVSNPEAVDFSDFAKLPRWVWGYDCNGGLCWCGVGRANSGAMKGIHIDEENIFGVFNRPLKPKELLREGARYEPES